MCNFLFVAFPGEAPFDPVGTREGGTLKLKPIDPVRMPAGLPAGMRGFYLVENGCSCDLFVHGKADPDLRKKGWSETKIKRAREQARRARGAPSDPGLRADVRELLTDWCQQFGQIAFAYFVTTGDPDLDLPTSITEAELTRSAAHLQKPPQAKVVVLRSR